MKQVIPIRSAEKATIFRRSFSSVPMTYRFDAAAVDGEAVQGEVEVRGSSWIFRKPPTTQPLRTSNAVRAGYWDTFFEVSVRAHQDLEVSVPKRDTGSLRPIAWIGVAVIAIVAGASLVLILGMR